MARAPSKILLPDDDEPETLATGQEEASAIVIEDEPVVAATPVRPVGMPKTVRIVLEEVENIPPTGQMFGLNGKAYCIRPGEPVDVPEALLEVIDHATMSRPILEPNTLKVIGHRDAQRFPYRVLRRAA